MNINNKTAIVTGGASGMGLCVVEKLLSLGAKVMVLDKKIAETNCESIICDVSIANDIEEALDTTIKKLGIPQICINCAGIAPAWKMTGKNGIIPLESFKKVIDINLVGTFNVMRVISDAMIKIENIKSDEERGVIINTASIAAFEGQIGQIAYSASKAGIVGLTLPAARELAIHNIRVNTIAPGIIATPLLYGLPQNVQDSLSKNVPYPKRLGKPDEFAALVIHIIENSYINGETIRLDGALRMQ